MQNRLFIFPPLLVLGVTVEQQKQLQPGDLAGGRGEGGGGGGGGGGRLLLSLLLLSRVLITISIIAGLLF